MRQFLRITPLRTLPFVRGFYWLDWAFLPIALTWLSGQKARAGNLNLETAYA